MCGISISLSRIMRISERVFDLSDVWPSGCQRRLKAHQRGACREARADAVFNRALSLLRMIDATEEEVAEHYHGPQKPSQQPTALELHRASLPRPSERRLRAARRASQNRCARDRASSEAGDGRYGVEPRDQKAMVRTDGSARHFHEADFSKLEDHIARNPLLLRRKSRIASPPI